MLSKIKEYMTLIIAAIIVVLTVAVITLSLVVKVKNKSILTLQEDNFNKEQTIDAYQNIIDGKAAENHIMSFTIDELKYSKDSALARSYALAKELGLKDKQIKKLQYQLSDVSKRDTIKIKDTLFVKNVDIDTTISDDYYKLNLQLKYPGSIVVNPSFKLEQNIVTYQKKEFVKPRKTFFLARWFQKRRNIMEVVVTNKNPYVNNKENRFVEIIKK
jgi:hypothetical protein